MKFKLDFTLLAGLILFSILSLFFAIVQPIRNSNPSNSSVLCGRYLNQIAIGTLLYLKENEAFPPLDTWSDTMQKYIVVTESFRCPSAPKEVQCSYAMNQSLSHFTNLNRLPPDLVMFFEIEGGWNVTGGRELLYFKNHKDRANIAFTDGHIESVSPQEAEALKWEPDMRNPE